MTSRRLCKIQGKLRGYDHGAGPEGTGTGSFQEAELAGCSESGEILTPPPLWPGGWWGRQMMT